MLLPRPLLPVAVAVAGCLPGLAVALLGVHLSPPLAALAAGLAILGSSFLLLWACDAAQADISQALALAVVALIAVLPEYAVDMYFTWQAGKFPGGDYSQYAIANMTGANRLLIGVAWPLVTGLFWFKYRRSVALDPERRTEIAFLVAATVYALLIPIKGSLMWYDGLVLMGLYGWYIAIASRRPCVECHVEGPAEYLTGLPRLKRRLATAVMFAFAAGVIIANAERFCEGLIGTGEALGISKFLLVQWLAPLASEAPEFTVAVMFALRGRAGLALGSLLSAKLNQWTLLVGMIPAVFALAHGSLDHPIPLGELQMSEILLTAAQSLLGVTVLCLLRLSPGHAVLLFTLFAGQLVAPVAVGALPRQQLFGLHADQMHSVFSLLYLIATLTLILDQPRRLAAMTRGLFAHEPGATLQEAADEAASA